MSIVCTNYNKGSWITDAIESFLGQKANFEYEILVIDDASTDKSLEIIQDYAKKYPEKIHAFYNKKNLGITRTWIKICSEAKGKYIARCDADDYWIDERKLEKQVYVLESAKGSLWCSTDYNSVTPEGEVMQRSAFESGKVNRPHSYAEMLVTKGFTMSSTWLVETRLMQEVNSIIDKAAVDDTFNIQLELFIKTKLTYLPESTVAYRINDGSDSHPVEREKVALRNENLLKTQLEYIDKYKDVSYGDMLRIILPLHMRNESLLIEQLRHIEHLEESIVYQNDRIQKLEKTLGDISGSRSYKLAAWMQRVIHLPLRILK